VADEIGSAVLWRNFDCCCYCVGSAELDKDFWIVEKSICNEMGILTGIKRKMSNLEYYL